MRSRENQLVVEQAIEKNEAVTSVIVGARRKEQVGQNVGGAGWKISGADMHEIQQALADGIGEDSFPDRL